MQTKITKSFNICKAISTLDHETLIPGKDKLPLCV